MILELVLASAMQTALIRNPSGIAFTCPDHALDSQHEVDVIDVATGQVISTILLGDPPLNAAGEVEAAISVQPIKFGQYRFQVRAVAGPVKSVSSDVSAVWERAPGKPGVPTAKGGGL